MNCQEVRERLPGLIDGELAPEELAEVEKHIAGCEECQAEKHRQEQFTTRVKTSLEDLRPSELFVKGVLDKLGDPEKKKREEQAAARRTKISLIAAGAVIVVVLVAAWIHAAVTKGDGDAVAATVTGYSGEAWMNVREPEGAWKKSELPREVPGGAGIETGPKSKVKLTPIIGLKHTGEMVIEEKSLVFFDKTRRLGHPWLKRGAVTIAGLDSKGLPLKIFGVKVIALPRGRAQVSLQYGKTVVVKVEAGTAHISGAWGTGNVEAKAGEIWIAPSDGSKPPEKLEEKP